ncbi:hypothetical protein GCK32_009099 [Trichostrongylus colubriformis]|uniref:Uncharacterized protein n=1 Tax=Trichostrongylus colubriformis TaxID=6319 RepID=A0AAN8IKL0_TRICO
MEKREEIGKHGVAQLANYSLSKRSSGMTEKSGTGAPSGTDAPGGEGGTSTGNQEGADDKDEKKELDGTGAGSAMGGTSTGGEGGTTGGETTGKKSKKSKKGKKEKKKKKKKTAHFKKRGHPCYKVLCIVFSLLSLASLATAMTMAALMLNEAGK